MADNKTSVLLIEDSNSNALTYMRYMREEDLQCTHVTHGREGLAYIQKSMPEIILLDMHLPDMEGMEILRQLAKEGSADRVIVLTGQGSMTMAIESMKHGASDFLTKPFTRERLMQTIRNHLKLIRQNTVIQTLRREYEGIEPVGRFIGASPIMQSLYRSLRNVASSDATVLITGESGTGKELCAEALHQLSARKNNAFEALNCAALPKDLLESEIFGHVKGAFTGAVSDSAGAAQRADGGTLFLDEICELDINLQAKLLRFIQSSEVKPLGADKTQQVDIRIIAATNRDPLQAIRDGLFREDLFYRLNVVPLHLPPLRERERDTLLIAQKLLENLSHKEKRRFQGLTPEAENLLLKYHWPGNVRELEHCIHRCVVLNDGEVITAEMLSPILNNANMHEFPLSDRSGNSELAEAQLRTGTPLALKPLREIELDYMREALRLCNNVVPQAAAMLDISPSTIYRRLKDVDEENKRG